MFKIPFKMPHTHDWVEISERYWNEEIKWFGNDFRCNRCGDVRFLVHDPMGE